VRGSGFGGSGFWGRGFDKLAGSEARRFRVKGEGICGGACGLNEAGNEADGITHDEVAARLAPELADR
jgi:hypothetical protein